MFCLDRSTVDLFYSEPNDFIDTSSFKNGYNYMVENNVLVPFNEDKFIDKRTLKDNCLYLGTNVDSEKLKQVGALCDENKEESQKRIVNHIYTFKNIDQSNEWSFTDSVFNLNFETETTTITSSKELIDNNKAIHDRELRSIDYNREYNAKQINKKFEEKTNEYGILRLSNMRVYKNEDEVYEGEQKKVIFSLSEKIGTSNFKVKDTTYLYIVANVLMKDNKNINHNTTVALKLKLTLNKNNSRSNKIVEFKQLDKSTVISGDNGATIEKENYYKHLSYNDSRLITSTTWNENNTLSSTFLLPHLKRIIPVTKEGFESI